MRNRVTGVYEPPDEERMVDFEKIVMPEDEDRGDFRRSFMSSVGAHRLDHPDEKEIDYPTIFPDLFRKLRDHYFEERKRQLKHNKENVLRYLSDERQGLDAKARKNGCFLAAKLHPALAPQLFLRLVCLHNRRQTESSFSTSCAGVLPSAAG